jgi:hypothetical protein
MTAFKNTIVGRILKGAAKVALPVVGAITGIGAISGVIKGVGALHGIGGVIQDVGGVAGTVKKVIDKVAVSAVNLVTGTTQPERVQVREQKAMTKAETDKWQQVDRLMKAGASRESAMSSVGVTDEVELTAYQGVVNKPNNKLLIYAGVGLAAFFLLPKILKGR